jgi:hypothetical protein
MFLADVRRLVAMDLQASVKGQPGIKPLMALGGGIMMRCAAAFHQAISLIVSIDIGVSLDLHHDEVRSGT